ncbi:hypothetical protein MC885_002568 [Smutsia gigantea]|nr:hypothetical protein MC885_002568 [Smutsia gigantea]
MPDHSCRFRGFILLITFFIYTCYHMSRKPISVVKSRLHQNCSELIKPINDSHSLNESTWCDWAPFGKKRAGCCSSPCKCPPQEGVVQGQRGLLGAAKHLAFCLSCLLSDKSNYKELLGAVDNAFLVAYAIGMFISGIFGERLPLRYYLSTGMLLSGLFTSLFGLGYFWNIHMLWYFVLIQICNGLAQTTGWPAVVSCVGNWFGKGKRGLIMGVWNSHTSVGNILGSLLAGVWVNEQWGLSFVVPGAITAAMGIVTFLFLIEYPEDVDCTPPQHHGGPEENQDSPEDPVNGPSSNRESGLESRCSKDAEPVAISFLGALRIPGVVEFSLCLLFAKLVSYTFLYWLPLYIFNVAHFSAKDSGDLSTLFDVGGIIGDGYRGLWKEKLPRFWMPRSRLVLDRMFLYNHIGQSGILNSIVMLIICGALVNGPYSLITTAVSADLGTHRSLKGNAKALSTVTAIIDGTGSIGAALGPLLAGLISPTGWNNVFYMLISADILACLLLCRLVYKEILAWKSSLSRDRGSSLVLTHVR